MNYKELKKFSESRLNVLKEALVRTVNLPYKTTTYDGILGSYIINPFGPHSYSFDIIFNSKECLDMFMKELPKISIYNDIEVDATIRVNGIHNHFMITGFINEALFDEFQLEIKELLDKGKKPKSIYNEKPTRNSLGEMK